MMGQEYSMFKKEFIKKMKESLGMRPAHLKKNTNIDTCERISGAKEIDYQELENRLKQISEKYKATGLTAAVVRNSRVEWSASFGYADMENGIAANRDTTYRVASISKAVTSMIVMTLWDKGIVDIDKDICEFLGFTVKNPYFPGTPITLRSLMTHTSSISDTGTYLQAVESGKGYPPLEDMLTPGRIGYSAKNFYRYEPGGLNYNYSNFGFGIIAAIIESVTGKRFNDYAREAVFGPLGLNASFLPNYISGPENIANIYRDGALSFSKATALKGEDRISKFPIGKLYLLAQGNLYISAVDLAGLMTVLMEGGVYEGKRILSKEAVDMINKAYSVKSGHGSKMRGLGIEITDSLVPGRQLRGHQGRAYGATNEMFYDITDKTGVVYLSNGSKYKKAFNGYAAIGSRIINAVYDEMK
jgi:Beta-lactamase class C and other penicillin binding proteins